MSQSALPGWFSELARRAATDRNFRNTCLSNPREAIKAVSDAKTAESSNVHFIEKGQTAIELPPFVGEGAEISEDQLMAVAGGTALPAETRTQC